MNKGGRLYQALPGVTRRSLKLLGRIPCKTYARERLFPSRCADQRQKRRKAFGRAAGSNPELPDATAPTKRYLAPPAARESCSAGSLVKHTPGGGFFRRVAPGSAKSGGKRLVEQRWPAAGPTKRYLAPPAARESCSAGSLAKHTPGKDFFRRVAPDSAGSAG